MTPATFRNAGLLPRAQLRSLDALHLATAIAIGADDVLTYAPRFTEAAGQVGLTVLAPR